MTALDAREIVDKASIKLELFAVILSDSLHAEHTELQTSSPRIASGIYFTLQGIADELSAASKVLNSPCPVTELAESGVHLSGILDALVLGYKACCLGIYGPDKRGELIKRHIDPLNWYLKQQGIDTGFPLPKCKSASGGAA